MIVVDVDVDVDTLRTFISFLGLMIVFLGGGVSQRGCLVFEGVISALYGSDSMSDV